MESVQWSVIDDVLPSGEKIDVLKTRSRLSARALRGFTIRPRVRNRRRLRRTNRDSQKIKRGYRRRRRLPQKIMMRWARH
jgi:hypothetical protein